MVETLRRLSEWYAARCDGRWEHQFGVQIETLDNPGWLIKIDLVGTPLEDVPFSHVRQSMGSADWMDLKKDNGQFHGACGTGRLADALEAFLAWADGKSMT